MALSVRVLRGIKTRVLLKRRQTKCQRILQILVWLAIMKIWKLLVTCTVAFCISITELDRCKSTVMQLGYEAGNTTKNDWTWLVSCRCATDVFCPLSETAEWDFTSTSCLVSWLKWTCAKQWWCWLGQGPLTPPWQVAPCMYEHVYKSITCN